MFTINKELLQAILTYLAAKPYNEVHELVKAVMSLKEIKKVEEKKEE